MTDGEVATVAVRKVSIDDLKRQALSTNQTVQRDDKFCIEMAGL